MKKINIIFAAALIGLCSCEKQLNSIEPTGSVLNSEQVAKGSMLSPEGALSQIRGALNNNATIYSGLSTKDMNYGYAALAGMLDFSGDAHVSSLESYDKFKRFAIHLNFNSSEGTISNYAWRLGWDNVAACNTMIRVGKENAELRESDIYAQAKVFRAWSYFLMAQLYGKTYFGHEEDLCIPIVDENTTEQQAENNPRATIKAVYDLIMSDLNEGINMKIKMGQGEAGYDGATTSSKEFISLATAYGIRARVALVMHDYAQAKADAQAAIDLATKQGLQPYSIADCSIPNFDKISGASNAMWGIIMTERSAATQSILNNFTSQMCSFAFGALAYTTGAHQYRRINISLYNQIPDEDVRKGWWLDADKHSPLLKPYEQVNVTVNNKTYNLQKYLKADAPAYTVTKFAPTGKNPNSQINSNDFCLMRIEEMYYILAEATFMGGNHPEGINTLVNFVKKYRNPDYDFNTDNEQKFMDEIYFQRRIEFWGEGLSWFDMVRLNKDMVRVNPSSNMNNGFASGGRFNIPAGSPAFVFQLPRSAEQRNKALVGHNNELAETPKEIM